MPLFLALDRCFTVLSASTKPLSALQLLRGLFYYLQKTNRDYSTFLFSLVCPCKLFCELYSPRFPTYQLSPSPFPHHLSTLQLETTHET